MANHPVVSRMTESRSGLAVERVFQQPARACGTLASKRQLGAFAYGLRDIERALDQYLDTLARQWLKLDIELLNIGDELCILHHCVERIAQDSHAFDWHTGWRDDGAADRAAAGVELVNLLVL